MKIETFYAQKHFLHAPMHEVDNGLIVNYHESPERVLVILDALKKVDFVAIHETDVHSEEYIYRLHGKNYINFLKELSKKTEKYRYPSIFPKVKDEPDNEDAKLGYYSFDTYTPVGKNTYEAAKNSADTVVTASLALLKGEKVVYALCRPPGHHAEKERMGGYCYINNSGLAANILTTFGKVAVLDFDAHHFNGTQNLFYERSDVFTVSIHGDPKSTFPFYSGFKNERGKGTGLGFNLNIPLNPKITSDSEYEKALQEALYAIRSFNPQFLVLSAGFDIHEKDPITDFKITTPFFKHLGDSVNRLGIKTVVVQEGGYALDILGESVVSLLSGFKQNKIFTVR